MSSCVLSSACKLIRMFAARTLSRVDVVCMLCVGVISMDVVMPLLENRRVNSAGLLDASWCVDDGSMRSGIFCKIVVV